MTIEQNFQDFIKGREEAFAEELLGYCGANNVLILQGFPPLPIDDLMERYKTIQNQDRKVLLEWLLTQMPKKKELTFDDGIMENEMNNGDKRGYNEAIDDITQLITKLRDEI